MSQDNPTYTNLHALFPYILIYLFLTWEYPRIRNMYGPYPGISHGKKVILSPWSKTGMTQTGILVYSILIRDKAGYVMLKISDASLLSISLSISVSFSVFLFSNFLPLPESPSLPPSPSQGSPSPSLPPSTLPLPLFLSKASLHIQGI